MTLYIYTHSKTSKDRSRYWQYLPQIFLSEKEAKTALLSEFDNYLFYNEARLESKGYCDNINNDSTIIIYATLIDRYDDYAMHLFEVHKIDVEDKREDILNNLQNKKGEK